jgi:hypothetical protein
MSFHQMKLNIFYPARSPSVKIAELSTSGGDIAGRYSLRSKGISLFYVQKKPAERPHCTTDGELSKGKTESALYHQGDRDEDLKVPDYSSGLHRLEHKRLL